MIQHDDGTLVGINRVAGESFEVMRDAQIVCKLNIQKLARQIVESLDGRIDYSLTAPDSKVHRLGRLPPKLASVPLHLSVHSDGDSLLASASSLASPFHKVLLVPSLQCVNIHVDLLAEQFKTIIVALDELIVEGEKGWVCQARMLEELGNLLGLGPTVDSNTFRIQGENYQICYGGKQFSLSGSVGLWYLRELLTHPHQEFDPVELESARTGIRGRSSTSPTGEIFDAEARRQYALRLSEVDEEIAEAAQFNDLGRLERLQADRQKILDHVAKATRKGGMARVATDSARARKNIRQQISRDIGRLGKYCPELAQHLKRSLQGESLSYRPSHEPGWQF